MDNNLTTAEEYLKGWNQKDIATISKHLDADAHFVGPIAQTTGKDAFVQGAQRMFPILKEVKLHSKFAAGDQVMLTYDFICTEPVGVCRTAELLTFKNGLISGSELFFDARPFEKLRQPQKQEARSA